MFKIYLLYVNKRTCLGVLNKKRYNETGLKEGGGTEISIYSAPFTITIITI